MRHVNRSARWMYRGQTAPFRTPSVAHSVGSVISPPSIDPSNTPSPRAAPSIAAAEAFIAPSLRRCVIGGHSGFVATPKRIGQPLLRLCAPWAPSLTHRLAGPSLRRWQAQRLRGDVAPDQGQPVLHRERRGAHRPRALPKGWSLLPNRQTTDPNYYLLAYSAQRPSSSLGAIPPGR